MTNRENLGLAEVETSSISSLWDDAGELHHPVSIQDEDKGCSKKHDLEVAIDVSPEEAEQIYRRCTVVALDHSRANTEGCRNNLRYCDDICYRYNQFGNKCPTPYGKMEAFEHLCLLPQLKQMGKVFKMACGESLPERVPPWNITPQKRKRSSRENSPSENSPPSKRFLLKTTPSREKIYPQKDSPPNEILSQLKGPNTLPSSKEDDAFHC